MKLSLLNFSFSAGVQEDHHRCCYYYGDLDTLVEYILENRLLSVYKHANTKNSNVVVVVDDITDDTVNVLDAACDEMYECEFVENVSPSSDSFFNYILRDSLVLNDDPSLYYYTLDYSICKIVVDSLARSNERLRRR